MDVLLVDLALALVLRRRSDPSPATGA